jgi:3-hydroxyisobutyrate dehydrogenase
VSESGLVGFIGLGHMGIPMAREVARHGYRVIGHDVSEAARIQAAAAGIETAELNDVAKHSGIVILMLPDSTAVASVLGDDRFLDALPEGALVIDMSSSDPIRTRHLARDVAARQVTLIDAPVSGGVSGAEKGRLTIMVGAGEDAFRRAHPVLETMGLVVPAGPVGAGHTIKALNNLLSATHLWATSEAMLAGQRFGLDPRVMLEIFNTSSGRSGSTETKWPNFVLTGSFNSGFGASLMLKDMQIAVNLIRSTGVPSWLGVEAVTLWARAVGDLGPRADHTEIAAWLRDHSDDQPEECP